MVIRKNISLENSHLKKLEPLTIKHNGNLSAAIRDAIDISEAALHRYGSLDKAISSISDHKKDLTAREKSIESGRNILLSTPIFLWMIKNTKGLTLDKEILDELLDPLKIITITDLDKQINELSTESGWNCKISIFSMDNVSPAMVTVAVSGDNEYHRDFLAQLVIMFLAYNKNLDIDVVHRRATTTRIDLKMRENGLEPFAAKEEFEYLEDTLEEFRSRQEFWKHLVEIYRSVNYNMVSMGRDHYEELLANNNLPDMVIFESLSKKHISSIPHLDFLKLLKKTHETQQIVDKIEILDNNINIYHNYKNEKAIQTIRDYYLLLLRANGHEYEAKYSSSLIVLNHTCCRN
jgi:hypothetical protein